MPSMDDDHDPTGHVWLSGSVNWICHICGRGVEVAEWLTDADGRTHWRWVHSKENTDDAR